MIKAIQKLFSDHMEAPSQQSDQHQARMDLAAAALLTEVIIADNNIADSELQQLKSVLQEHYHIDADQVEALMALAQQEVTESNDFYQFTRLINDHYEYSDKCLLIENLWRLAYADAQLDKYEEYSIRKIAELIYVSHGDFIQAKMRVKQGLKQ